MKILTFFSILVLLTALTIVSCKKDQSVPDFHFDYFNLTPNNYVDYEVMEIDHDINLIPKHDTTRYFLRTLIGDTVIDNEGRVARKFIRFKKNSLSQPWIQSDIWTAIINNTKAELIEENQRVIKLVFSPTVEKEWNANVYNTYEPLTCQYRDIHVPQTIKSNTFENTLVVEQQDEITFISYKRKFEVYAKSVGLVYKHFKELSLESGFDTLDIKSGKELFYTCIGHGTL